MSTGVEFEHGRLYVEARHSVLFFARVGGERLSCYITCEALVMHFGARQETANAYKYCLCAYDRNTEVIHQIAAQCIDDGAFESDGAIELTAKCVEEHRLALAA
jgi:hypothetical protein